MKKHSTITIGLLLLAGITTLGGCGLADRAEELARDNKAAETLSETFFQRCLNVSLPERMKTWAAAQTSADKNHPGTQVPIFDCPPQDGKPDFTVQDVIDAGYYKPPGN